MELSVLKQIDNERSLSIALKSYYSLNQIKLLLKYGANTTSNYYHNNSSVKIAIERCSNEMVKLILENTPKEYIKINNNNILLTAFRINRDINFLDYDLDINYVCERSGNLFDRIFYDEGEFYYDKTIDLKLLFKSGFNLGLLKKKQYKRHFK